MSDDKVEPGEMTERFRTFAQSVDPEPRRLTRNALLAGGAIVVVVALIAIWMLIAG